MRRRLQLGGDPVRRPPQARQPHDRDRLQQDPEPRLRRQDDRPRAARRQVHGVRLGSARGRRSRRQRLAAHPGLGADRAREAERDHRPHHQGQGRELDGEQGPLALPAARRGRASESPGGGGGLLRTAFIETLNELADKDPRVCLVVGDLGYSVIEEFASKHPDQFVNAGVAEQNMIGLAVGMALSGKVVFTYSIANFGTLRCLEQIRNDVCYHRANVKVVAVGCGLAYGNLGVTHHASEDVAIMRALPNMTVVATGDPIAAQLAEKGLSVRLLSMHTIKPLDREAIVRAAAETRFVFTLEEHSIEGGLGGAVAEVMAELDGSRALLKRIGLRPQFNAVVGDQKYLKSLHGLDEEGVMKTIQPIISGSYRLVG